MISIDENIPRAAFWFRRDLRLFDNYGLHAALKSGLPVLPVFIFDTDLLNSVKNPRDPRVEFIYNSLKEIDHQLKTLGSSLIVEKGRPVDVWRKLCTEYGITKLYMNRDFEPYAVHRDEEVRKIVRKFGAELVSFCDQVIFAPDLLVKPDGKPYTVFTPYKRAWLKRFSATANILEEHPIEPLLHRFAKLSPKPFPPPESLGCFPSGCYFPPRTIPYDVIRTYHLYRDYPAMEGTTRLGIHLRFGTVSIRQLVRVALELNDTWLNELIWREFFMMILNHFPHVVHHSFRAEYDLIAWRDAEQDFERWKEGTTGYPLVDAGMRQLRLTGFMHNRLRMVTAGFLVKHLLIDWRRGEQWFAEKLLDYELSSNNGNWQWAAGTGCDAAPYFRIFNPNLQMKRFDPQGTFVKQWVPEFGTSAYPTPIVDYSFARQRAIDIYARASRNKKALDKLQESLE